jgi:hypothetical protein
MTKSQAPMPIKANAGLQKFESDGLVYDLNHLSPFTIAVTPKADGAPTFTVLVTFGHHCFTREWREGADDLSLRYAVDRDVRCFCPERYSLSLDLPAIVTAAATGKVYFSQDRNYLIVEAVDGMRGAYAIFFKLEKAKRIHKVDAVMFVVSAYEKRNLPTKSRLPSISFATLIAKTVRGERIIVPKK